MQTNKKFALTSIGIMTIVLVIFAGCNKCSSVEQPWTNSLGMRFIRIPNTNLLFSEYETQLKDYRYFKKETGRGESSIAISMGSFNSYSWNNPGFDQTDAHPVVQINYEDAKAFCEWLTDSEKKKGIIEENQQYRLPTSEEWSRAQGISTNSVRFPWGDTWPPPEKAGNFFDSFGKAAYVDPIKGYTDGFQNTAPVGSFTPNSIGLYDMAGNVLELCIDCLEKTDSHAFTHHSGRIVYELYRKEIESAYLCDTGGSFVGTIGFRCILTTDNSSNSQ